jgi:hypothetical protein
MGQSANNAGRNASLDAKKRRAAGRQKSDSPEREAIKDSVGLTRGKGAAGGAFGAPGRAARRKGRS